MHARADQRSPVSTRSGRLQPKIARCSKNVSWNRALPFPFRAPRLVHLHAIGRCSSLNLAAGLSPAAARHVATESFSVATDSPANYAKDFPSLVAVFQRPPVPQGDAVLGTPRLGAELEFQLRAGCAFGATHGRSHQLSGIRAQRRALPLRPPVAEIQRGVLYPKELCGRRAPR